MGDRVERTFPLRSANELARIITSEWSIPVEEHELQKPTAELVQNIYSAIVLDVISLDVHKFERDRLDCIGDAEYPEYYHEGTTVQMLFYHIGRIAKMAKVKVFQARDLTRPDGPRTIRILSAIVNFKAFSDTDERITWLHDLRTRYEKSLHRYSTVCDELEQLEQELEEEQLSRDSEIPATRLVKKGIEAIVNEQNQHYDFGKLITKDTETLKNTKKELTALLRQRATDIQELHRSNAAEKARLVRSPERIKQRIVDMSATSEALKPQISQIEAVTRLIQAKMEVLHTIHHDTKDVMKDLQAIENDLEELHETSQTVERYRADETQRKESLKNYQTETTQVARQRQNTSDKLQRLRQQHAEKQEFAKQKHEDLQRRHQELVKQRTEREAEMQEHKDVIDRIVQEQNKFLDDSQAEIDALMEENYRLEKIIGAYMSDLDKELSLGLYLSKHGLSEEEQKKAKRRKKAKAAPTTE